MNQKLLLTYFALLTSATYGIEIEDISSNLGILPIRLGPANRINYYHTLTHYYRLDGILNQARQLRTHFEEIVDLVQYRDEMKKTLQPRIQLVEHMLSLVEEKSFESILPHRQKRGLLNGIGSVVKYITGNLDANDEQKYDKIIQTLQANQETTAQQISHHYSINNKLIEELNLTIDSVAHNQDVLTKEIQILQQSTSFSTQVKQVENALEHNQLMVQLLLDLTQDIDNSVTFCKLKKLHPSIIRPQMLLKTLRELSSFFGNTLPDFEGESLWEIQNHIKVKCFFGTDEIVYFLDIPIVHPEPYDLILLQPLPTKTLDDYVTVIPSTKYALKPQSSSEIIFSNDPCEPGVKYYFCPNNLQLSSEHHCETDILLHGINGRCDLVKLNLPENHVELLEETKRYIFVFPKEEQIKIIDRGNIEFKTLSGIFLVSPGNGTIEYRNRTLIRPSTSTLHNPSLVKFVKLPTDLNRQPQTEIKLKSLRYLSAPSIPIVTSKDLIVKLITPSLWTILLYVIVASCFLTALVRYLKYRPSQTSSN